FVLFLLGFMKAAWMPFHSWLPTAMAAPTPVSALLHAVAVVKAGVFGIVRVVCYIYGVDLMHGLGLGLTLAYLATFTLIVANLFALAQDNLKRRLAYSTINQLSLIIFGVALLAPEGIEGAMMHIPFHGFMKITLFMCAGAIMVASGKKNISEMAGIGKTMPVTMTAFTIGALGMCALPPTAGYITHHFFVHGCEEAGGILSFFPYILLIVAILDVMYFFPIIYTAFFEKSKGSGGSKIKEAPLFMLVPITITAIVSIIFYFYPDMFYISELVEAAVRSLGGVHP
ncbi:MAG TPA: monovalent cation/H+ antiporter subunit D family protein, partial [Methanophagales archaeon]|nr:monovalent cation/H+ antiporter subunit D family protein [Methanophagales archaeon]